MLETIYRERGRLRMLDQVYERYTNHISRCFDYFLCLASGSPQTDAMLRVLRSLKNLPPTSVVLQ
jgi:hypothetical protein